MTAVAAGEGPDASVGWSPSPLQYAAAGQALPVDSILDKWKAENNVMLTDIPQEYYDFYKYDGHYYGIPYRVDPRVITYRTDLFEQAGITQLPTTWDEFKEVCRKLKAAFPDKVPFLIAGASFMATHAVIGFGANNGTGFVNEKLEPNMTSPAFIEMLNFFKDLRAEGLIRDPMVSRFTMRRFTQIAAGLALAVGGAAVGRMSAGAPVVPVPVAQSVSSGSASSSGAASSQGSLASMTSAQFKSPEEAWDVLNRAGEEYQRASAYLSASNTEVPMPTNPSQYRTRLAALDGQPSTGHFTLDFSEDIVLALDHQLLAFTLRQNQRADGREFYGVEFGHGARLGDDVSRPLHVLSKQSHHTLLSARCSPQRPRSSLRALRVSVVNL
jgi:ABC-type glycerol-3-phosphate transport system substrate-binding protein